LGGSAYTRERTVKANNSKDTVLPVFSALPVITVLPVFTVLPIFIMLTVYIFTGIT